MKRVLLTYVCFLFIGTLFAQKTYLSCDFSNGIPSNFTLRDLDSQEPSNDMKKLGFSVGIPWIATKVDKDSNMVACSTSWYRKASTSNDWMITPVIHISSENAIMTWHSKASDKDYSDGYSIYISDKDTAIADFNTNEPLFSINKESSEWTTHSINLNAYIGKDVYIAFVNNSKDKFCLYIDDIFVGEPSSVDFSPVLPSIINYSGNVTICGKAFTNSGKTVTGFTVGYDCDGKTYSKEYPNVTITPNSQVDFSIDEPLKISPNQTVAYNLWIKSGTDEISRSYNISSYLHKIIAEEATGTWCGYCVRGIVYMDSISEKYPDSFIGIAVHNNDVMKNSTYDSSFNATFSHGFPTVFVNRNILYMGDPTNLFDYYNSVIENTPDAGIELNAAYNTQTNEVTANTRLFFVNDQTNASYRLAYVITEDNINEDNSTYNQHNYYSENAMGKMGGYENKPDPVLGKDMTYNNVARCIEGGWDGIDGSVPSAITAGQPVSYEHTFTLPTSILNKANTQLIVMLINHNTGLIVNSEKISLGNIITTGVQVTNKDDNCKISVMNEKLSVESKNTIDHVSLYNTNGQIIKEFNPLTANFTTSLNGFQGLYIIKVVSGSRVTIKKIIIS